MLPEKSIDIKENDLLKIDPELLSILLKDKTYCRLFRRRAGIQKVFFYHQGPGL